MAQSGLSARFRQVGGAPATSQMLALTDHNAYVPAPNAGALMPRAVGLDIYVFGPNDAAFNATMANLANLLAALPAPYPNALPNVLHSAAPIPWQAIPMPVSTAAGAPTHVLATTAGRVGPQADPAQTTSGPAYVYPCQCQTHTNHASQLVAVGSAAIRAHCSVGVCCP